MSERTLKLTLTKKWFDMILSGEKTEEYREVKPYWVRRLTQSPEQMEWGVWEEFCGDIASPTSNHDDINDLMEYFNAKFKSFQYVEFVNGYGRNRPRVVVESSGVTVGFGKPKWGAGELPVFIISLGKIIVWQNILE